MTTKDWRDLPAGRELDRLVAERAGWRVARLSGADDALALRNHRGGVEAIVNPLAVASAGLAEEEWLWSAVNIPHYSTSVDAALTLVAGRLTVHIESTRNPQTWQVWVADGDVFTDTVEADNPALAIVRAWLSWREQGDD